MNPLVTEYIPAEPDLPSPDDAPLKPFTLWKPSEFAAYVEPPNSHLLLPRYLSLGSLTALVGPAGVGKTRLALALAVAQILAREWCGLKTAGEPQRWGLLGTENSISRWREDLARIMANLSPADCAKVEQFLRIQAVIDPEDFDASLKDPLNRARLVLTLREARLQVIGFDPLSEYGEDLSKPGDMKEAVRWLFGCVRQGAPGAGIVAIHHAKPGRSNIAGAVGYDASAYASGGKGLVASARCQINVAPGDAENGRKLVLSCGKVNDCERFTTRGLLFDPDKCAYTVDGTFDLAAWQAEVAGKQPGASSLADIGDVVEIVRSGITESKGIIAALEETGIKNRSANRLLARARDAKAIVPLRRGKWALGKNSEKYAK